MTESTGTRLLILMHCRDGMISKSDLSLFSMCDTIDEAYDSVIRHLRKYYSKEKEPTVIEPFYTSGNKKPSSRVLRSIFIGSLEATCGLIFSIRFLTEGFTKNVRFLYSFRTPDLSYFFLNVLELYQWIHFLNRNATNLFHLASWLFSDSIIF